MTSAQALSPSRRQGKEDDPAPPDPSESILSDYKTATGHDRAVVEIADGNQVRYWCHELQCTEAQLRESVQAVGTSPVKVRKYLEELGERGVF